jgi:hypothetical protein
MAPSDADRIKAAFNRAISAVETHQEMGSYILAQTAPPIYPSRPTAPMPEYMKPEFDDVVRARFAVCQPNG